MGAIANALMAYAQPLLDQTDGSLEQMNKALTITQLCYNLALLPEEKRAKSLSEIQSSLALEDEEFDDLRGSIILPMIRRHEEMFPRLHRRGSTSLFASDPSPRVSLKMDLPDERPTVTDRYAQCPCNSGKKYKFCCGAKPR